MPTRGRTMARAAAIVCGAFVAVTAVAGAAYSQAPQTKGKNDQKSQKLDKAQEQEARALYKLVDAAAAGQAVPSDIPVSGSRFDSLKALDGKTYVPFILAFEPGKLTAPSLAMYIRVVKAAGAAAAAPAPAPAATDNKNQKKDDKNAPQRPEYAFEDIHFMDVKPPATPGQPTELMRAFAVPGGDYTVYIAFAERAAQGKNPPPPKTTVFKQAVTVPDYWNNEIATSSILLADRVEPVPATAPKDYQTEHPYTFGSNEIIPSITNTFTKKQELSILFLIYNTQLDQNKKPDVTVEYNFYQKNADGEKFFNKTNPQVLNASTLPAQFDIAAGHQLVGGQTLPLASFPEGNFRLEIKVTDKLSSKVVTKNLDLKITP